jgi:Protein of Unknown function (DUF2784)
MRLLLADFVLIVHFLFVAFVVGGFALIWVGAALRWNWVRNFRFRVLHLVAIAFVAAESIAGVMCPLTVWEDALRGRGSDLGFIARWVHGIMFYDLPAWIFTTAYVGFALVVAATWWLVPPVRTRQEGRRVGYRNPTRS